MQNEELLAENGELRLRLAEATEALDAIRRGEVDAIVVQRADGPKVYTITGADEPYRVMVEEMQEGAVTLREDGIVVYCNKQIARMLRTSHQSLLGKPFRDFLVPADLSVFEALLPIAATRAAEVKSAWRPPMEPRCRFTWPFDSSPRRSQV